MPQIKHKKPPRKIWKAVVKAGMNPNPETVIFTYGDTIYVPSGNPLPEDLIEHESLHTKQQGDDPDAWWERYIKDEDFRIDQEAKAYGKQYAYLCKQHKDRNAQARILMNLARILSGPLYGNVLKHSEAMKLIKDFSK